MNILASVNRYFANRESIKTLSQMDPCQLADLGLSRKDIFDSRFMDGTARVEFLISRKNLRRDKLCL
ncbi:hypothetical protein MNBD_ALPHA11-1278 [hydrothermal vent metagenome]|uniref:YjiS-like domain-containing protein n=1 Tax=hydrothermal vent metagenome TaxID=652676 RepID=A0A3B0TSS6_9ZZZZ